MFAKLYPLCFFLLFFNLLAPSYAQPGKDCSQPFVVNTLPFQQANMTTSGFGDDYSTSPCGDPFMDGDDFVITYTPVTAEKISILLENVSEWTGLHVLDNCPDIATTCIAKDLNPLAGNRLLDGLLLNAGVTYYFVISTFPDPQSTNFDLSILSQGAPPAGTSCDNPLSIAALPFQDIGQNTVDFGDLYSGSGPCQTDNYLNGNEIIYTYQPTVNEAVTVELQNITDFFAGIQVMDACPDAAPNCLGSAVNAASQTDLAIENLFLEAGKTYYLVVSTFENPQSVGFDLQMYSQQICEAPTTVNISQINSNSALAEWNGEELYWSWQVVESGMPPVALGLLTEEPSISITNLDPETNYDLYLQSHCGPPALILTGVYDGPLSGGTPKGVELLALYDIPDLSLYGIGSANNGDGSDGEEFTFPAIALVAGSFVYWTSDSLLFKDFFGFFPQFISNAALINGNDAVELFREGQLIDQFGFSNVNGTGSVWDYQDGWAYRQSGQRNNYGQFNPAKWRYSGINELEGGATNATCDTPFPIATFIGAPTIVSLWSGPFSFRTRPLSPECMGFFVDEGGFSAPYFSNSRDSVSICPDNPDELVVVHFTAFEVENNGLNCLDALTIYDGADTNAAIIASPDGNTDAWCWNEAAGGEKGSGNLKGRSLTASSTNGCLTFIFSSNDTIQLRGWEAEVTCEARSVCLGATNLHVSNVSNNFVELNWQSTATNSVETIISWGLQGVAPDDGTQVGALSNPFLLTGLQPNTTYDFYVRENCGSDGISTWSGPFTFSTLTCPSGGDVLSNALAVASLPYTFNGTTATCYTNQFGELSADVFFTLQTDSCTFYLELSTCSAATDFDTYLYLLDESGNTIAFNDESPEGTCDLTLNGENRFSVLEAKVTPLTTYYVVVEGFGPNEGNFELHIQKSDRSPIETDPSIQHLSCYQENDGAIELNLSGGASPYLIQWGNGASTENLDGLAAGTYSVTITDGCQYQQTASINITQPDLLQYTATVFPADPGKSNGYIRVTPFGGSPPYTYAWDGGSMAATLANLSPGSYCVRITDKEGCMLLDCIDLPLNTALTTIPFLQEPQLYPNPITESTTLYLAFERAQMVTLEISDLLGRIWYQTGEEKILEKAYRVEASTWPAGVYYLKAKIGNGQWLEKLVVQ